ncbi:MAG: hypothetical protein GX879_10015 [Bacteroidales bacterium]|nr:hypothetical protein [Bacteroidales bacterium]
MKKYFFIAIFLIFNFTIYGQVFPEPPAINYFQYLDFEPMNNWSEIKIWGWSKNSKLAYSNKKIIDGRGGIITTVFILDIKTDAIVFEKSIDTEDFDGDDKEGYNYAYRNFMCDYIDVCAKNGIEFAQTEFKSIPIKHNTHTVNVKIEKEEKIGVWEESDIEIYGNIGSYKLIAKNKNGQKTIHQNTFMQAANDVIVCGYFNSPFEDRALIIIGEYVRAFEGWDVEFILIGCHLSNGFQ